MSNFQTNCYSAIDKISDEDITLFNNAKDPESRIKIIYEYAKRIPVEREGNTKNLNAAIAGKTEGNSYFQKKNYRKAIMSYNTAIMNCPQDTDSSMELLAILVANRSATFFELQEFKKVLNDIDYIIEIDKYPKRIYYKILLRKARCYDAFQNLKSAEEIYSQAIEYLKYSELDEKSIGEKIMEIKRKREERIEIIPVSHELMKSTTNVERFSPNEAYLAVSSEISFELDQVQGRYARAKENIPAGQIVVQENPHCCILTPESSTVNCQHCLISTDAIRACPGCSVVVFCSNNCERLANKSYHKYECAFQKTLFKTGASMNCLLALRLLTQKNFSFFLEKQTLLRDFLRDDCKTTYERNAPYRSDDYTTVFFLCRNESFRDKKELLHYTCMSIYLLKLLRTSDYFHKYMEYTEDLTDDEVYAAALLLRHLELLQFNCHEIAELVNNKDGKENDFETSYELTCIGAGIYPTAALFNHSCDPSVIRYNIGNKLIVRAIKPIGKNEMIYDNYGPIFTTMKREFRQQFLNKRYWFDCECPPCVENWPLLAKMDENEMRISCRDENCPSVFVINKNNVSPFLDCDYCTKKTNLFPMLKNLMNLQNILSEAEHLYANRSYPGAIEFYLNALNILYGNLRPPCPDMVKVQQRLRTCFIHYGNKSYHYTLKLYV